MKNKNLLELHFLLIKKKKYSVDLTRFFIKRINNNFDFNVKIIDYKYSFILSYKSDKLIDLLKYNILTGLNFSCKDNFVLKNNIVTCGSKILKNFISPYSSTILNRLKNLGCNLLIKTNMNEFSVGNDNCNYYYGNVKNAWQKLVTSGGSSGGSFVSVALRLSPFSLATDTGGSCRQPGVLNNVISLKSTYGIISRYGIVAYASSLDNIGILSFNLINVFIVLNAISGLDIKDSSMILYKKRDFLKDLNKKILTEYLFSNLFTDLTLGISKNSFFKNLNYNIRSNLEYILIQFEILGAQIFYFAFSFFDIIDSIYYIISSTELSSNLSKFDGFLYGYTKFFSLINSVEKYRFYCFNNYVKDKIIIGNYLLSSKYGRKFYFHSKKIRRYLVDDFQIKFKFCNIIILPVLPILHWYLFNININFWDKIFFDIYTTFVNILGLPSLNISSGFYKNYKLNIPLGLQFIANYCKESLLLQLTYKYQKFNKFYKNFSLWV